MYRIINGKKIASEIKLEIAEEVESLRKAGKKSPIWPQFL